MRLAALLTLLATLPLPALAQEVAPDLVAQRVLAHQLFAHAAARKDPLTMLAAARLSGLVGLREVDRRPTPDAPTDGTPLTAAMMDSAAQALVQPEETLALLLDEARREQALVPAGMVQSSSAGLAPGASHNWTLPFDGGLPASIGITGDGAGHLSLRVAAADGTLICAPETLSDAAFCAFVLADTAYVTATVTNAGETAEAYVLLTN